MRKLAGITIASFSALALTGAATGSPIEVGSFDGADIIIEKQLPDDYDAELPPVWLFRIDAINCGNSIFPPSGGGAVDTLIVEIDAEGGQSDEIGVSQQHQEGGFQPCAYRIIELPVDGWEPVSPPGGVAEVVPQVGETVIVPFENRPPPPETTTTTTTTTEPEVTTTTVAETTTTTAATTTAAPTTAPPTTAGTVAPELPATGSSNALAGLLAGLLVLGGLGAVLASRRS